jgi:hypothetical protein
VSGVRFCNYVVSLTIIVSLAVVSCGPSQAELEYEEYLKAIEETQQRIKAEEQAQEEKKLEDIRNWCIEAAIIVNKDIELIVAWNQFREDFRNITPYSSLQVKIQQDEIFSQYMESYGTLLAEINSTSYPAACFDAHRALSNYLSKHRPAIMELVKYYASGQPSFLLQYQDKLIEINGLRKQYQNQFFDIVDEWDMEKTVIPYLTKLEELSNTNSP